MNIKTRQGKGRAGQGQQRRGQGQGKAKGRGGGGAGEGDSLAATFPLTFLSSHEHSMLANTTEISTVQYSK